MIFFDAHVHCYPEYDPDALLAAFAAHAAGFAPPGAGLAMAVLLRPFQPTLSSALDASRLKAWRIERPAEGDAAAIATDGRRRIALFPARQVAARERVELLGLFGEAPVPDGLPLSETSGRLRAAGFLPVIAWGRGKWLFRRAGIVRAWMAAEAGKSPKPLVGDSALRPPFWPEPLFGFAARRGLRLTFGSDPLPGAGNERRAGAYATLVDAPMTFSCGEMRACLAEAPLRACGRRSLR